MVARVIIRGDSYALRRPLYQIQLLDTEANPFDLTGCTVRTTYKITATSPSEDPDDSTAAIRHQLTVDASGEATIQAGLFLVGNATEGTLEERLTADETRVLPLDTQLLSDVKLTDANGEYFTWESEGSLSAKDTYTNRTTNIE